MEPVNLGAMLARFTEHWSPKKIAQVNDYDVRIVKVRGEFTWHQHPDTDELFLVLSGQLTIQMRDRDVVLAFLGDSALSSLTCHMPRHLRGWRTLDGLAVEGR